MCLFDLISRSELLVLLEWSRNIPLKLSGIFCARIKSVEY